MSIFATEAGIFNALCPDHLESVEGFREKPQTTRRSILAMLSLPFLGRSARASAPAPARPTGPPTIEASPEQARWLNDKADELVRDGLEHGRLQDETDALNEAHWDYCADQGHPFGRKEHPRFEDEESRRLWNLYSDRDDEAQVVEDRRENLIRKISARVRGLLDEAGIEPPRTYGELFGFMGRPMAGVVAGDRTFMLMGSTWPCSSSMEPGTWGDYEIVILEGGSR